MSRPCAFTIVFLTIAKVDPSVITIVVRSPYALFTNCFRCRYAYLIEVTSTLYYLSLVDVVAGLSQV
jgi:hypothetical protein